MKLAGYKLIHTKSKAVVQQWGGVWGECPGIPNPLVLPNGDHVWAPVLGASYRGHKLVEWLVGPGPEHVKQEAQRRIVAITGGGDLMGSLIRQINGQVSDEDKKRINAIRARSNEIEAMSPIPDNLSSDDLWDTDE